MAAVLIFSRTPLIVNLWFLAIEPAYVIPKESSILRFKPTQMNPGSGDWWLYGQDQERYYYFFGKNGISYVSYRKDLALGCLGFMAKDFETWCLDEQQRY